MKDDLTVVYLEEIPNCQIPDCGKTAGYDAKTYEGPWAYLCIPHYWKHRYFCDLGTGKGQAIRKTKEEADAK